MGAALNWLDCLIIATVVSFVITAYTAGLIREIITLVALIVGVVIAGLLYDDLARDVLADTGDAALAISFFVLLGAVYLIGQIAAYTLKKGVSLLMLGRLDHLGGAFFGLIKGLVLVEVLLLTFAAYPGLGLDDAVEGSALAPMFLDDVDFVLALLPSDFDNRVSAFLSS
jgi:membrane protein required for colicin V production